MTRRQKTWTLVFLGATVWVIGMEVMAAFDSSSDTLPWTALITHYVPRWLFWPTLTALVAWIIWHFLHQKWGRDATQFAYIRGQADILLSTNESHLEPGEIIHHARVLGACRILGIDPDNVSSVTINAGAVIIKRCSGSDEQPKVDVHQVK